MPHSIMRHTSAAAVVLAFALSCSLASAIDVSEISFLPSATKTSFKNATNQKNITTWAVQTTFWDQFQSVQSCLPLSLTFLTANNASENHYKFVVNTTSLDQSYNLRPFVKNGIFTLALNGTLTSSDLVNVTVTVPDALASQIVNVTATGQSYVAFNFKNVTDTNTFQAQIAATGVVTLVHNLDNLLVYASTNGSANLDGKLGNVNINYASTQPVVLTNAKTLTLAKTGKGSVFIGNVTDTAYITMAGTGAVSANLTNNANIIQQGAGSVLMGLYGTANVTYAGGKNSTFFNGVGTAANDPATVNYFNSGNGTLVFTGNLVANGVVPPPGSCVNITGFSNKNCTDSAIIAVPKNPEFPVKRPRCKGGDFVLKNSEQCYATPKEGFQCRTTPPVNGGYKFLLVLGIIIVGALLVFVNGL
jgi:hypothetical protein